MSCNEEHESMPLTSMLLVISNKDKTSRNEGLLVMQRATTSIFNMLLSDILITLLISYHSDISITLLIFLLYCDLSSPI